MSVIKRMDGLKDAVVNMSQGDRLMPFPNAARMKSGSWQKELDICARPWMKISSRKMPSARPIRTDTHRRSTCAPTYSIKRLSGSFAWITRMRKRGFACKNSESRHWRIACLSMLCLWTNEEAVLKRMASRAGKRNPSNCEFVELAGFYDRGADGGYRGAYVCGWDDVKTYVEQPFSNILKYADKGKPIMCAPAWNRACSVFFFDQYDQAGCRHGGKQSYWLVQQSEDGRIPQVTDACLPWKTAVPRPYPPAGYQHFNSAVLWLSDSCVFYTAGWRQPWCVDGTGRILCRDIQDYRAQSVATQWMLLITY